MVTACEAVRISVRWHPVSAPSRDPVSAGPTRAGRVAVKQKDSEPAQNVPQRSGRWEVLSAGLR
jgi:hypothetical protein